MEKLTEWELEVALDKVAREAAKERIKYGNEHGAKHQPDDEEKYYNALLKKLTAQYPYASVTNRDIEDLQAFGAKPTMLWLDYGQSSPRDKAKAEELEKILPLLYGMSTDGKDWYNSGVEELRYKANELGFDAENKEDFAKFLKKLADYQTQFDRAQNLADFRNDMGALYWPSKFAMPSFMQEGENAIATGEGGDPDKMYKMLGTDMLANGMIVKAPGMFKFANQYANGFSGAALQAAVEAARQGAKAGLSETGQEFEFTPVVAAGTMGATRPAVVGGVQRFAGQFPGATMKDISRGIGKATRAGNPVANEREALAKMLEDYNKLTMEQSYKLSSAQNTLNDLSASIKNFAEKSIQTVGKDEAKKLLLGLIDDIPEGRARQEAIEIVSKALKNETPPVSLVSPTANYERLAKTNKANNVLKLFGISKDAEGKIPVNQVLEKYDLPTKTVYTATPDGVKLASTKGVSAPGLGRSVLLGLENGYTYKSLFPAKYADEAANNLATRIGLKIGQGFGELGSRVEPTLKVNPFTLTDKLDDKLRYEEMPWYSELDESKPEEAIVKKIIDEAMKRKLKRN